LLIHLGLKAWPLYRTNFLATPYLAPHARLRTTMQDPTQAVQDFPMHPEPSL
jgi:hypothetical protein